MATYASHAWWVDDVYNVHKGTRFLPFDEILESPADFAAGIRRAGVEAGRNAVVSLDMRRSMFHIHVD